MCTPETPGENQKNYLVEIAREREIRHLFKSFDNNTVRGGGALKINWSFYSQKKMVFSKTYRLKELIPKSLYKTLDSTIDVCTG